MPFNIRQAIAIATVSALDISSAIHITGDSVSFVSPNMLYAKVASPDGIITASTTTDITEKIRDGVPPLDDVIIDPMPVTSLATAATKVTIAKKPNRKNIGSAAIISGVIISNKLTKAINANSTAYINIIAPRIVFKIPAVRVNLELRFNFNAPFLQYTIN